jgi:hypothetical protein
MDFYSAKGRASRTHIKNAAFPTKVNISNCNGSRYPKTIAEQRCHVERIQECFELGGKEKPTKLERQFLRQIANLRFTLHC